MAADMVPVVRENRQKEATLVTDEAGYHTKVGREFAAREIARYGEGKYGRGEFDSSTIEGCFSISKRGMKGVYRHCYKKHLQRNVAEFEFHYHHRVANGVDGGARANRALTCIIGKRRAYDRPNA